MATGAAYPLVFTFRDLIAGDGFLVGVIARGRVLLSDEDGGCWMSGVTPGAIAAGGATREDAFRAFKERYHLFLQDVAKETPTVQAFENELLRFFEETNESAEAKWQDAWAQVRSGKLTTDGLPREPDTVPRVEVHTIETPRHDVNDKSTFAEAA